VLRLSTSSSVVFHLSVALQNVGPYCGYKTVRTRAKVTIDSLQEVVCEKSISTKMNDLDLCLEVMSNIVSHSTLNISETIRDRGLVPKDRQYEMAYGGSNGTDDVTWPWKDKLVTTIRLECNISKTVGDRLLCKEPPMGNIWGIKWSRDRWRHVTPKGAVRQYGRYPSDSLASCCE